MVRLRTRAVALSATALLAVLVVARSASAVEVELKYDSFVDNGQAVCQQGFGVDDQGGVTFTHDQDFVLQRVQFLFCGADETETVTIRVYRDTGGAVPGEQLYQGDYEIAGSADALSEIDLTGENLAFSAGESFRFALLLQHAGPPGLANDADGSATPGTSWLYDANSTAWGEASSFGVTGDWIMRAYVDVEEGGAGGGGAGPASTSATMMAGAGGGGGAGGANAEDGGDEESTCGCRLVGEPVAPARGWWALAALGWVLLRRRR